MNRILPPEDWRTRLEGVLRESPEVCRRLRFMEHEASDKLEDSRRRGYQMFIPAWIENLRLVREELAKRGAPYVRRMP
jgi:hypothetical protein